MIFTRLRWWGQKPVQSGLAVKMSSREEEVLSLFAWEDFEGAKRRVDGGC
jgi:hypothetical protein